MNKTRTLGLAGSISLILMLFVVLPGVGADDKSKDGRDGLYRPLGLFSEVLSLVRTNYVEPVELKPLLAGAFSGMTEAMDPFSEYVPPEKMAAFNAFMAAREKKETLDSGIVLARRFGYPVVVSAIAGSPAAVAGVKSDDVIEKIDDKPARSLALWEAEALFSGKAGGRVHLLVVREGKPRRRTIDFVRSSWSPERPSAARVEGEIVVKIPAFAPGTAAALKNLLTPYDKTRALILDLRGNALGTFEEAAHAAALFVPPGPLGELKGRKIEAKEFRADQGERVHDSRLVLLVDSGTAGAAELFCSAIRDAATRDAAGKPPIAGLAGPAKVDPHEDSRNEGDGSDIVSPTPASAAGSTVRLVGEPTFGMGFSAQVVKLASGGALKLSVGKIHSSSGRALSPKGIEPDDRVFALPADDSAPAPAVDPVLQRGLKALAELTAKTTTKAVA